MQPAREKKSSPAHLASEAAAASCDRASHRSYSATPLHMQFRRGKAARQGSTIRLWRPEAVPEQFLKATVVKHNLPVTEEEPREDRAVPVASDAD